MKMFTECGVQKFPPKSNEISSKIIGGQIANANSWPWQVYLTDNMISCGGTVIATQWIATASHCTEA